MWKRLFLCLAFSAILLSAQLVAQQKSTSATEALNLFKAGRYTEAAEIYASLLKNNDRNLTYNYYYGVCLYELNRNSDEAIRRLRLSSTRPGSVDVYFYLGKLYQQIYEMELAVENLERFLKLLKTDQTKADQARNSIEECKSGISLVNKYFDVKVIRKDTIAQKELLNYYSLSKDAGQIMSASDFFRDGVDSEQVIFKTERGNVVFFPIKENNGTWDIYKMERLLDSWNEEETLGEPVNSASDELYPFLLTDGVTLYFCSNRPGGMGGFDIYQSIYDPETRTYSAPANMGSPFNSPADDYFLVPDALQNKAWFATTRGVSKGSVVIAEIVWDESVIKNNTENINQLRTLAALPVSSDVQSQNSSLYTNKSNNGRSKIKNEINFVVNDTLTYTFYNQFQSTEALETFKSGFKIEQRKDSLNSVMASKRKAYSQSYNQNELKQLIEEIVALEKQTYVLDEEINRHYIKSRQLELYKIEQLKREGNYRQSVSATPVKKVYTKRAELLKYNLKDFSYYTDEDFRRNTEQLNQMYVKFFTSAQIEKLQQADSLYLWGKVLSLESAKVLEQTRNVETTTTTNPLKLLKNNAEEETTENVEIVKLISQSREMKQLSLDLYEEALNIKYNIYYPVAVEFTSTSQQTGSEYMLSQASSNFRKAEEEKNSMILYSTEKIERIMALKKHSVGMLEESFNIQSAGIVTPKKEDEGERFYKSSTVPSYPLIQKGEDGITPENMPKDTTPVSEELKTVKEIPVVEEKPVVQKNITSAVNKTMPVYKIQIGAFRNEPNAQALAKIPAISSVEVPGNGLKKYFTGSWNKYSEAQAMVQSVRDAGFPGAFIVAFINDEQVTIEKAQELEKK